MTKNRLDGSMSALRQARVRLEDTQSSVKRRNARREFIKQLKDARRSLDLMYPAPPKRKRHRAKVAFKTSRAFDLDTARLFTKLATDSVVAPTFGIVTEDFQVGMNLVDHFVRISDKWSSRSKWEQVVYWVARVIAHGDFAARRSVDRYNEAVRLFDQFWVEPLPVSDLPLAAEHDRFLEDARKRSDRAKRATATRKQLAMRRESI